MLIVLYLDIYVIGIWFMDIIICWLFLENATKLLIFCIGLAVQCKHF